MSRTIVVVGVPTALGGQHSGQEQTPARLRELGLLDLLVARPGLSGAAVLDSGDLAIEPGFHPDAHPTAKNARAIAGFLPRERDLVAGALGEAPDDARLLVLGGDCTAHAGALAGIRRVRPERRLAIAWFDAHGDFNTPDTTPSGDVWGMPFAMLLGRGSAELVGAAGGPTVAEEDAALFGGQVLDETESRMLAASPVAHFGAGMLATNAGMAAVDGWASVIAGRVDGIYIAVDHDVLDGDAGWAVQMPEPEGLSLETAARAIRTLAARIPVDGFGATGVNLVGRGDRAKTVDAVATLVEAALGNPI